jgi:hypothetical protein
MHVVSNYPVWFQWIEEKLELSRYLEWTFISCTGTMKVMEIPLLLFCSAFEFLTSFASTGITLHIVCPILVIVVWHLMWHLASSSASCLLTSNMHEVIQDDVV